jgi:uncharacterized protein (TIGR03435 family)
MRTIQWIVPAFLMAAIGAQGQPAPSFEVASVKVAPPRTGPAGYTSVDSDGAMARYSNISLHMLIAIAYKVDSRLIQGGPAWLDSTSYDVVAKLPPDTPKERIPEMLATLLTERFKVAVHRETKEQRAYFLVVGKDGPKLKEGTGSNHGQISPGGMMGRAMPASVIAGLLARIVGYQVVDKTGLKGTYDFDVRFAPENSKESGPDIFAAIQEQLGLKLEPGKAPVETLIVDHAERIPSDN